MELSIFRFHRWWFQKGKNGRRVWVIVAVRVSRVAADSEGLLLLWGEWKPSLSQIPSYQRGHGGSTLISIFWINLKESVVFFCQIKNYFPPFECLRGLFSNSNCSRPRRWCTVMGLMDRGSFDLIRPLCPLVSCRKFCSLCRKRRRAKTIFFFF